MYSTLLGSVTPRRFLAEFWQRKPLIVRNAMHGLADIADRARLLALARRDDVESRIVRGSRHEWHVEQGPFSRRDIARLPAGEWTLLVNGVETLLARARAVQHAFDFVPFSRHDDIMISYAAPGGSVGPHFDSYDVFLLQASGTREWHLSAQKDLALIEGAPLKLLRTFRPHRTVTLNAGDMLYLPPRYAHYGIASGECITWSVGFRAPSRQEIAGRMLDYLHDTRELEGHYRDPGLAMQRHPSAISKAMLDRMARMIEGVRWSRADVTLCVGAYLSEPRVNTVFTRGRPITRVRFAAMAARHGLRLSLKTRMLCHGRFVFINGEAHAVSDASSRTLLLQLADRRRLESGLSIAADSLSLLHEWHRSGYLEIDRSVVRREASS